MYFFRVREQQTKKEAQALDGDEADVCLIADLAALVGLVVDAKRHCAADDIPKVAERKPGCKLAPTLPWNSILALVPIADQRMTYLTRDSQWR